MHHPRKETEEPRKGKWRPILWLWGPPVAYTALIFGVSSIRWGRPPMLWEWQDKVVHFAEYAVLSALLLRALKARFRLGPALAIAALMASSLGGLDELLQSAIPSRTADVWDAVADSMGAIFGGAAMALLISVVVRFRTRGGGGVEEGDAPEKTARPKEEAET